MSDGSPGLSGPLERWGRAAENAALVILLAAMMILAVGQIVMRLAFSSGFVWADELLKLMVLWIALIASIAASRGGRHLRIDLLSNFVPQRLTRLPRMVAEGFAAGVCGLIAWESWRYVQLSLEFDDTVLVNVPSWIAHGILPLAFALMTWRFLLEAMRQAWYLVRPPASDTGVK